MILKLETYGGLLEWDTNRGQGRWPEGPCGIGWGSITKGLSDGEIKDVTDYSNVEWYRADVRCMYRINNGQLQYRKVEDSGGWIDCGLSTWAVHGPLFRPVLLPSLDGSYFVDPRTGTIYHQHISGEMHYWGYGVWTPAEKKDWRDEISSQRIIRLDPAWVEAVKTYYTREGYQTATERMLKVFNEVTADGSHVTHTGR